MTHTAVKDLVRLRKLLTGESYNLAKQATSQSRISKDNLIPDASDRDQVALEADLLAAIVGGPTQGSWWPADRPILIESVSPSADRLDLVVAPANLGLFCWRIVGKPGSFRPAGFGPIFNLQVAKEGKGNILLRQGTSALIRLRGCSWRRWVAAMAEADSMPVIENPVVTRIAARWRADAADKQFEHSNTASMLLRRAGLFREPGSAAQWIRSGTQQSDGWEWLTEPPQDLNDLLITSGLRGRATSSPTESAPSTYLRKRRDTHSQPKQPAGTREPIESLVAASFSPRVRDSKWHAAIYKQYRPRVLQMLLFTKRVDYHAAEDIYQDVLMTVWNKRQSLPEEPKLKAWIFVTAKNHLLNYVRRRTSQSHEQLDDTASTRYRTAGADSWIDASLEIRELNDLPVTDRQILSLVIDYEFSCKEAAQILGITSAAARQRLKRAREKAKALVQQPSNGGDVRVEPERSMGRPRNRRGGRPSAGVDADRGAPIPASYQRPITKRPPTVARS